jgi:NAD(P)-dependent dehydrogenase (short-subunit alcohol dehydrogenase family)
LNKTKAQYPQVHISHTDVGNEAQVLSMFTEVQKRWGQLNILVNNAGIAGPTAAIEDTSLHEWQQTLDVNLTGAFLMCKYAVPHLREAGGGSIINIASQLGHVGVQNRAPYCTTKAALIFLTKILAQDHAPDHIRANSISPGFILTERSSKRVGGKDKARLLNGPRHLLNRPGEPEEIAAGAAFLASADSSFVTGTDLLIDGGYVTFKGRMTPEGKTVMVG